MANNIRGWSLPFSIVGISIGIAIGIATENLALGIGLAAGLGIVFGRVKRQRADSNDLPDGDDSATTHSKSVQHKPD